MSKRIGTGTIPRDKQQRSANPTRRQQIRYWRIDHGIRIQILSTAIHNHKCYAVLRKRGERIGPPMTWAELIAYVEGETNVL